MSADPERAGVEGPAPDRLTDHAAIAAARTAPTRFDSAGPSPHSEQRLRSEWSAALRDGYHSPHSGPDRPRWAFWFGFRRWWLAAGSADSAPALWTRCSAYPG